MARDANPDDGAALTDAGLGAAEDLLSVHAWRILEIDDTVNPVGVECWILSLNPDLDDVPEEVFMQETEYAKEMEAGEPGSLRMYAEAMDAVAAFDAAQAIVAGPRTPPERRTAATASPA